MKYKITTISLSLPLGLGSVNCYLVEAGHGFILVDTGGSNKRAELEQKLVNAGCKPGNLNLIVITHGDFDHTGNAAYLRERFGAQIAMHKDDSGMAERGDMFWNRKKGSALVRWLAPLLFRFDQSNRFMPDFYLDDGRSLADFGFDAIVVALPGHSKGSIGIFTASGELLCGDLFDNTKVPALNSIMDNPEAAQESLQKLGNLSVGTVFPGHGRPFPLDALFQSKG